MAGVQLGHPDRIGPGSMAPLVATPQYEKHVAEEPPQGLIM